MKNLMLLLTLAFTTTALAGPKLPKDIKWETNTKDPVWADPKAEKGGTFRTFISSYPLTFRTVGPDSNGSFRSFLLDNSWDLIDIHPNTAAIIPALATHWAFAKDNKSMYFKINPKAKWSDGKPVTSKDWVFALKFMRSKNIVAPWYNNHYTEIIKGVTAFDDHTIQIELNKAKPRDDLHLSATFRPIPTHFYNGQIGKDFVKKYNWEVEPVTGPYTVDTKKVKKGKSVTLKKVDNWWAANEHYVVGRYNVEKIRIKVIRDYGVAWEHFLKNKLDTFAVTLPSYWHDKAKGKDFDNGYIKKLWFYTDQPESPAGMWLNQDKPLLGDINIRKAIAHATNIDKVIKQVLRNDYFRLHHANVGYGDYTKKGIKARDFDLKKAASYLKKAGFTKRGGDGIMINSKKQRLSFDVTYSFEGHTPRLVVIKEEMKKAGIELNLRKVDGATGFKSVLEKKHEISWMGWSTGMRPSFWQGYHSANAHKTQTNNITNTDNKKLDKLIMSYRDSVKREDRIKYAHQVQEMLHEEAMFIPTFEVPYYRNAYWGYWKLPKVPGTKLSSSSFSISNGIFWLDKKAREKLEEARDSGKKFGEGTIINKKYKR